MASGPILDSIPFFDVGGTVGSRDPVLLSAAAAVRMDSTIVVADSRASALRFFAQDGRLVRTAGRVGGGPGEFRKLSWLGKCNGDTLFAADAGLHRITVFGPSGSRAREFRIPTGVTHLRCSRTGTIAAFLGPRRSAKPSLSGNDWRLYGPLLLLNSVGDTIFSFGSILLGENRPLGVVTYLSLSDDRVYIGTGESSFVDVFSRNGRQLASLPVGTTRRPITQADFERAVDWMVSAVKGSSEQRRLLLALNRPQFAPAYGNFVASPSGGLWILVSEIWDTLSTYRVLSEDGVVLGDVTFRKPTRILEIGDDYVVTSYVDSNGEPHVAAYRVSHGGALIPAAQ